MKENENQNMKLWNTVSKTDPRHTKRINIRGGITSIDAQYQIQRATESFGPVGIGWGFISGQPIFFENDKKMPIVIIPVTLWHGDRENSFGPIYGACDLFIQNTKPDTDAIKKATTDALTKGLSLLGFSSDVFLGRFDDNKYVSQLMAEFTGKPEITKEEAIKMLNEAKSLSELKECWSKLPKEILCNKLVIDHKEEAKRIFMENE